MPLERARNLLTEANQVTLFFPDGGKTITDLVAASGEPLNEDAATFLKHGAKLLTVAENWAYNDRRDKLRAEFHALMKARGVDVILCPPYVGSAPIKNGCDYGGYTMIWNMLDHPALVFPSGLFVDSKVDVVETEYVPTNDADKLQYSKCKHNSLCAFAKVC
jgi:amidase